MSGKALVLGASGFLGSHVTKQLVEQGRDVRILVRETSNTSTTDHLDIERCTGDVLDEASLDRAMEGCSSLFYCVVDTRAWLRDPAPLYRVNLDGLRSTMDAALRVGIERFVYTSTLATIGHNPSGLSTEADEFNWWDEAPPYVRCRVESENLFLDYCRMHRLPGVACCIGNTYGDADIVPTPHGGLVKAAATKQIPFYWCGGGPSVGIKDAARGMILAEEKGKVGERYIIVERWVDFKELFTMAAEAAGVRPPPIHMPMQGLYALGYLAEGVTRLLGKENPMNVDSIKCSSKFPNMSSAKAQQELGWVPRPIEESVKEAVDFYLGRTKLPSR